MISEIYSDVSADDLERIGNEIKIAGGTFAKADQGDGKFTLFAQIPGDPPPEESPPPGIAEFPWMPVARGELGVKEGVQNNPRISQYFVATGTGPLPATVPWCSAFVNFCVTQAGLPGTGSAMARSWLNWGHEADGLQPGCIVVLSRGAPPSGHVGFFVGMDGDRIRLLGGNQHDAVCYSNFPAARIVPRGARIP